MRRLRLLLLYASSRSNETLAYQHGWPERLGRHRAFDVTGVNLARRSGRLFLGRAPRGALERVDAVVLLHSVFSNEPMLSPRLAERVASLRRPKVFFMGNEYKLMPQKLSLARQIGTALLVTQSTVPEVARLYQDALGCAVVGIPSAAFDPALFAPRTPWPNRPVDIGYRGFPSPLYLGHDERRELAERVRAAAEAGGFRTDISLADADRFDQRGWADFLDRCRCQIGSEAGADYFELTDETRNRVEAFVGSHPHATIADVRREFFDRRAPGVSGRALSGRVVEAAATKTVQLLLEGEYGGYFEPGRHFIPLRHDYANLDAALEQLRDEAECLRIAEAAYEVARSELTYERIGERLRDALLPLVEA